MSVALLDAFDLVVELCMATGNTPVTKHAGCWEYDIDAHWRIAVNGRRWPMRSIAGIEIPARHCYATYDGRPAALFGPHNGVFVNGHNINRDALCRAIRAHLAALSH